MRKSRAQTESVPLRSNSEITHEMPMRSTSLLSQATLCAVVQHWFTQLAQTKHTHTHTHTQTRASSSGDSTDSDLVRLRRNTNVRSRAWHSTAANTYVVHTIYEARTDSLLFSSFEITLVHVRNADEKYRFAEPGHLYAVVHLVVHGASCATQNDASRSIYVRTYNRRCSDGAPTCTSRRARPRADRGLTSPKERLAHDNGTENVINAAHRPSFTPQH